MKCSRCGGVVAVDRLRCGTCGHDMLPEDIVSNDGGLDDTGWFDQKVEAIAVLRASSFSKPLVDEGSQLRIAHQADLATWRTSAREREPMVPRMSSEEAARLAVLSDRMKRDRWRLFLVPAGLCVFVLVQWLVRR